MKEITLSDIGAITGDYKVVGVSLTLIFVFSGFLYCWRRAGSLHFFLDRLWLLIGGRKEFHDKKLNEMWEGVRDVELFRYRSGFSNVYSKEKIRLISDWLQKNKIELSELIRVIDFFDVKNICLKQINYIRKRKIAIGASIFLGLLICLGTVLAAGDSVLFYVVKTDKYFSYSGKEIYIYGNSLDLEACQKNYPVVDNMDNLFEKDEDKFNKIVACKIFDKNDEYLKDKLKLQRIFIGIVLFYILTFTIPVLRLIKECTIAEDIYFRIYKKKSNQ